MKNVKRILAVIIIIILALGTFMVIKKGFNYGIEYTKATELKFMLGQVLDMNEVNSIVNEAFNGKSTRVQKIDYFNDTVNITVADPTDEEIQTLVDKFNSRYNQNNTLDSISRVNTANISLKEIVKPYILPVLLVLLLSIIYMGIRYKKNGIIKTVVKPIFTVVLAEALLFAIYAIVRIPVNFITIPVALVLFIIVLTIFAYKFEKAN